jgi:hypothetical protein
LSDFFSERLKLNRNFSENRRRIMSKNMSEKLREVNDDKFYLGAIKYEGINFELNEKLKSNIISKLKVMKKLD